MSPVATRVESWLKPAHVTESLWPAKRIRQILRSNLPERYCKFKASLGYIQVQPNYITSKKEKVAEKEHQKVSKCWAMYLATF